MNSHDFVKIDTTLEDLRDEWTDQETLLLLEGLEMYGESWNDVAAHVGSKNVRQCVLHFLRLPIEDPYLEDQLSRFLGMGAKPIEEPHPFASSANPIMTMISFLSSSVDPRVAAAAAQAAMKVIGLETEKGKDSGNETTQEPKSNSSSAMDLEASSTGDNKATSSEKMETDEAERGEAKRKDENGDKEVQTEQQAAGAPTEPPKPANNNDDDGSWLVEEEGKGEIPISQRQYISSATPSSDSSSPKIASPYIDPSEIKAAAAAAIGAAAARAKILADAEEREIQRLVAIVVEVQLRKLDAKLEHFHQLEQVLEKERLNLEQERQKLFAERAALQKARISSGQMQAPPSSGFPLPVSPPQQPMGASRQEELQNRIKEAQQRLDMERHQVYGQHPPSAVNLHRQPSPPQHFNTAVQLGQSTASSSWHQPAHPPPPSSSTSTASSFALAASPAVGTPQQGVTTSTGAVGAGGDDLSFVQLDNQELAFSYNGAGEVDLTSSGGPSI